MQDNFAFFFKRVLEDEGTGYEDVPGDNGGPTKCGITIADVARFNGVRLPQRGGPGWDALVAKVRALDPATAGVIYRRYYWDDIRADDLPSGLDYSAADYAVNSGPGRAVPVLRHIVGLASGSAVDAALLEAIGNGGDLRGIINRYQDERRAFLEHIAQIPHNAKFRTGWLNREARVRKIALNLASAAPAAPTESPKAHGEHPNDAAMGVIDAGAAAATLAATVPIEKPPLLDRVAPNAAKVEELAGQGSRIAEHLKGFKTMLWRGAGTAVTVGGAGATLVDPSKGNAAVVGSWSAQHPFLLALLCVGVTAVIVAGYAYYKAKQIEKGLVTAANDGRYSARGAGA